MNDEIWKDIPSGPGYEVSDQGQVRMKSSHVFNRGRLFFRKAKMLKQYVDRAGYLFVNLFPRGQRSSTGTRINKKFFVHRLVLEAFEGKCPEDMSVDHINRNRQDNSRLNLRYADIVEQNQNRDLSRISGEQSRFSKLTCEQVIDIRNQFKSGETIKVLGKTFNVSSTTIRRIVDRKTWKDC